MRAIGVTALAALLFLPFPAAAQRCTEPLSVIFERVSPAVVSINSLKINKGKPQRRFSSVVGSGFILGSSGLPTE